MSGIGGILSLGNPVDEKSLKCLSEVMFRRGPKANGTWLSKVSDCGLVCTSLHGESPIAVDERFVVVGDVRLDYRDDLKNQLDAKPDASDVELVLAAYARWGKELTAHLEGEFAFAIYDRRSRQLFCARDHFGQRPFFYYHVPGRVFAFASEVRALLNLEQVPTRINEQRILDHLCWFEGLDDSTFYTDIRSLPQASRMELNASRLELEEYWSPFDEITTDATQVEDSIATLRRSVNQCAYDVQNLGVMLSGGIDSASVAAFARSANPSVTALSLVSGPTCNETRRNVTVRDELGLAAEFQNIADLSEFDESIHEYQSTTDDPFSCVLLVGTVYRMAKKLGLDVVLDGTDGGLVMSGHPSYPAQHFRDGNYWRGIREVAALTRRLGGGFREFCSRLRQGLHNDCLPNSARRLLDWWERRRSQSEQRSRSLVNSQFASRMRHHDRYALYRSFVPNLSSISNSEAKALTFSDPHLASAFDRYNRLASFCSVEPRHPFMSKRLIKTLINVPLGEMANRGWRKFGFRASMQKLLPGCVCWPTTQDNLMPVTTKHFINRTIDLATLKKNLLNDLGEFVDRVEVGILFDRFHANGIAIDAAEIWHLNCLWQWYRRH